MAVSNSHQHTIIPIHTCHQSCWDHPGSTHKYCNLRISHDTMQYPVPKYQWTTSWCELKPHDSSLFEDKVWNGDWNTMVVTVASVAEHHWNKPWTCLVYQEQLLIYPYSYYYASHLITVKHGERKETTTSIIFIYQTIHEKVSVMLKHAIAKMWRTSPSMYFREIYQSWVKDPIDPTRLKRRRTLEWIQEKLGLLGWWGESILMIIHSKSSTESWSFNRLFGRLMFQFPGQAQEIPWKNNSSSNGSQAESLNGLGWASPWVTPSCCVYRIRWTTSYFHAFQIPSLQVAESIWRFEGNAFKIQKPIDHGQHLARRKVHTVRKTPNGH